MSFPAKHACNCFVFRPRQFVSQRVTEEKKKCCDPANHNQADTFTNRDPPKPRERHSLCSLSLSCLPSFAYSHYCKVKSLFYFKLLSLFPVYVPVIHTVSDDNTPINLVFNGYNSCNKEIKSDVICRTYILFFIFYFLTLTIN